MSKVGKYTTALFSSLPSLHCLRLRKRRVSVLGAWLVHLLRLAIGTKSGGFLFDLKQLRTKIMILRQIQIVVNPIALIYHTSSVMYSSLQCQCTYLKCYFYQLKMKHDLKYS